MLLSLNHHYPAPPPPIIATHHHRYSPLFPIPKILILQPKIPLRTLTRAFKPENSTSSQTLPHSAIQRIADKLRALGFATEEENHPKSLDPKPGEIFIPLPNQLPKYRVGHTLDPSWSTPENPVPRPGSGYAIARYHELRKEVKRERETRKNEGKVPSLAELNLTKEELKRLMTVGVKEKRKLKVGKAGITEGIVNGIHERWRRAEVVNIVCEDLCRMNMKRTHDLLEVRIV